MGGTTLQERWLPSPPTQTQRVISITLIIRYPPHTGAPQGISLMFALLFQVPTCVWVQDHQSYRKRPQRVTANTATEANMSSPKINICARVEDFHSSPINHCILFSRPSRLRPVLYLNASQKSNKSCLWTTGRWGCLLRRDGRLIAALFRER